MSAKQLFGSSFDIDSEADDSVTMMFFRPFDLLQ